MNIYYATADTVPVKDGGVFVMVVFRGIFFLHPDNEQMFKNDCTRYGAVPIKVFDCTGFDYRSRTRAAVLNWPEMA